VRAGDQRVDQVGQRLQDVMAQLVVTRHTERVARALLLLELLLVTFAPELDLGQDPDSALLGGVGRRAGAGVGSRGTGQQASLLHPGEQLLVQGLVGLVRLLASGGAEVAQPVVGTKRRKASRRKYLEQGQWQRPSTAAGASAAPLENASSG
jgi:hypothetical protein